MSDDKISTLDYMVETTERLRQRYPAALIAIFDYSKGVPRTRAGQLRGHVFDFQDGLRFIVARELMPDGNIVLHLSASINAASKMYAAILDSTLTRESLSNLILQRFRELSGDDKELELSGWSDGGVPHWFRVLEKK